MNPWLESPYLWPDFHNRFAFVISNALNEVLPKPYYARLEMRPEVGVVEDDEGYVRRIVPDVSVVRLPGKGSATAVAEPESAISDSLLVSITSETIEHPMVEVRDPSQGHQLVTLIEIVSPANKIHGPDRDSYFKKQAEVLASSASLVEIDLLRGGKHLFSAPELFNTIARYSKRADYVALVNRSWKRLDYQIFPMSIMDPLAVIPLPLRKGQAEVKLNLQSFFATAYASGPYSRGAVDYSKSPHPPLPADLEAWAAECLQNAGVVTS
jgi:hypothetical protein